MSQRRASWEIGDVLESIARTAKPHAWHQGIAGGVMQILGLLPDPVMAGVLEATLDTPLAWPLITCMSRQRGNRPLHTPPPSPLPGGETLARHQNM